MAGVAPEHSLAVIIRLPCGLAAAVLNRKDTAIQILP